MSAIDPTCDFAASFAKVQGRGLPTLAFIAPSTRARVAIFVTLVLRVNGPLHTNSRLATSALLANLPYTPKKLEGFYVKDTLVNHRLCVSCRDHIGVCANGARSSGWAHLPDRSESRIARRLKTTHGRRRFDHINKDHFLKNVRRVREPQKCTPIFS